MTKDLVFRGVDGFPHPTHSENDANFDRVMYWAGQWVAGTYTQYEVVETKGSLFSCAVATTTTEPGTFAGIADWDRLGNSVLEVWQATPILSMNVTTIQWTFIPIFTGQTPQLLSEASGVFTFLTNGAAIEFQLNPHISFEYAANNSEASFSITPTYSGAGVSTLLPILDADSSARLGSFARTPFNRGTILAALSDTLSFVGDSAGTNGSDVDLVNMFLQVSGPTP
jgi:hypothetical protein